MNRFLVFLAIPALLALAGSGLARQEPDDEAAFERAMAERSVRDNCLICHTPAMTDHQRLTPAQWAAEVDKMIGWGAPVPPEDRDRMIEYLAREYPADMPPTALGRLTAAEVRALDRLREPDRLDADPDAGAALYVTHCASCHGPDALGGDLGNKLLLSPVLLDHAAYAQVVRQGRGRMPAFAEVLQPPQEDAILAWLRDRKLPPP